MPHPTTIQNVDQAALDKILPALVKARKEMKPAEKTKENKYDNYKYADEAAWNAAVQPHLLANGLFLTFVLDSEEWTQFQNNSGGQEWMCRATGRAVVYHESGQSIECRIVGEGADRRDKSVYKAMTGMKKYGYALLFALPTDDDVEKNDGQGEPPKGGNQSGKSRRGKRGGSKDTPEDREKKLGGAAHAIMKALGYDHNGLNLFALEAKQMKFSALTVDEKQEVVNVLRTAEKVKREHWPDRLKELFSAVDDSIESNAATDEPQEEQAEEPVE